MSPISNQQLLEIFTGDDQPTTTKTVQRNKEATQIVCTDGQRGATANPSRANIEENIEGTRELRIVLERIPSKRVAELSRKPKAKRSKPTSSTVKRIDLTADSSDEDLLTTDMINNNSDVVGIDLDEISWTSLSPEPQQNGHERQNLRPADLFRGERPSSPGHSSADTVNTFDGSSEVQVQYHRKLEDPRLATRRMPGLSHNQAIYHMAAQSSERNDLDHHHRPSVTHVASSFPPVGSPQPLLTIHHQPCHSVNIPSHQIDGFRPAYSSQRPVDQMATSSFQIRHPWPINSANHYPSHPMSIPAHPMSIPSHPMSIPSHQIESFGPMYPSHQSVNQMAPTFHQIHHPTPINLSNLPSHQMAGPFQQVSCPRHMGLVNHQPRHQMNGPSAPYPPQLIAAHDQRPSVVHMAEPAHFNSYNEPLSPDTTYLRRLSPEHRPPTPYPLPSQQNIHRQVQSPTSESDNQFGSVAIDPRPIGNTDVSDNESNLQNQRQQLLSTISNFTTAHSNISESLNEMQKTILALKSKQNQIRGSFLGLLEIMTRL